MIWARWIVMVILIEICVVACMLWGWGLWPKNWWLVILFYTLANTMIPFMALANRALFHHILKGESK